MEAPNGDSRFIERAKIDYKRKKGSSMIYKITEKGKTVLKYLTRAMKLIEIK